VRARRLAVLVSLVVLVVVVLASAAARQDSAHEAVAPPPSAARPSPVVDGALPADRVVHARAGDVVRLSVRTKSAATVAIPGLGVDAIGTPDEPARFVLTIPEPGRYAVVVDGTGRRLGTISVQR